MKIKTQDLQAALKSLSRITSKRQSLPILDCVKLYAKNNTLFIEASNLDEHQIESIECKGPLAPCCVGLRRLEFTLGGDELELELELEGDVLTSRFGGNVQKLKTLQAEEFPNTPTDKFKQIGVACLELAEGVDAVKWAASADPSRHILQTIHIAGQSKTLTCVSTNGRELAVWESALIGASFEATVPEAFAGSFSDALRREDSAIFVGENHASVTHKSGSYFCKLLDGKYPNWKQVVPSKIKLLGSCKRADWLDIFNRCNFFANPAKAPDAKIELSGNGVTVKFDGQDADLFYQIPGSFGSASLRVNAESFRRSISSAGDVFNLLLEDGGMSLIVLKSVDLTIYTTQLRGE